MKFDASGYAVWSMARVKTVVETKGLPVSGIKFFGSEYLLKQVGKS